MKISHHTISLNEEIHVYQYNPINLMCFYGYPKGHEDINTKYLIGKWHVKHKRNDR